MILFFFNKKKIKQTRLDAPFCGLCPINRMPGLYGLMEASLSCTPDREIQRFTPCEKFLSHPRYLTPSHAAFKCSFLTLVVYDVT